MARRARASTSHPVASTLALSVIADPDTSLMVSTRRVHNAGNGTGMTTSGSAAKFAANSARFDRSWLRSMADLIIVANSDTRTTGR